MTEKKSMSILNKSLVLMERVVAQVCAFSIFYTYTIGPVYAQTPPSNPTVIVDPESDVSFRPDVWFNQNEQTPIVDITTPENGVSFNRYDRFDVDENGVVLNNATQEGVSALAGTLRANPNLQGLAADIIINEVTSGNISELAGAIEVFGQSADVIVANPNGLTANGASFINTNRATLTTGVPIVGADGSINLIVREGQLAIGREGLDATDASDVQIAGRTVSIDGAITSDNDLIVSGGAQDFNPATGEAISRSSLAQPGSSFAVDATAFGVMQGGRIKILGNETGLGVRALGDLSSGNGGTDIMSLDSLMLGSSNTTGDLTAQAAGDLTVVQDFSALGDITLEAGTDSTGSLAIETSSDIGTGGFYSGGTATLTAGSDVDLSGDIQVLEDLNVTGRNISSDAEITELLGDINLAATQNVDVSAGRLSASAINIDAGDEARIGNAYVAAADVNVSGTDVALGENAIFSADAIVLAALEDFENAAQLVGTADEALNLSLSFTQDFRNLASGIYLWDAIDLTIAGSLTNAGWIEGEESVALALGSLNNLSTGIIKGGTVAINISGDFVNVGDVIADAVLEVTAQEEILNTGRLSSSGDISLEAVQRLRNDGAINAAGDLTARSLRGAFENVVGNQIIRQDAEGSDIIIQSGVIFAAENIELAGISVTNQLGTLIQSETGRVAFKASDFFEDLNEYPNVCGVLNLDNCSSLGAGYSDRPEQDPNLITYIAPGNIENYGTILAGDSLILGGRILPRANVPEISSDVFNAGYLYATHDIVMGNVLSGGHGNFTNASGGRIETELGSILLATSLDTRRETPAIFTNEQGASIVSGSGVQIWYGDNLKNSGFISAVGNLLLSSESAFFPRDITGGMTNFGGGVLLSETGDITINVVDFVVNETQALIQAGGRLQINTRSGDIQNDGTLQAADSMALNSGEWNATFGKYQRWNIEDTGRLLNSGVISSGGNLDVKSFTDDVSNFSDGVISAQGIVTINAGGQINDHGLLLADSIDFAAAHVETRRSDDYALNGIVRANSYNANVGSWFGLANSVLDIGAAETAYDINIVSASTILNYSDITTDGAVRFQSDGDINLYGTGGVQALEDIILGSTSGNVNNFGALSADQNIQIGAGGFVYNRATGAVTANGDLLITAGTNFQNMVGGVLSAGNDVTISANNYFNNYGSIAAIRDVNLRSDTNYVLNRGTGTLRADRDLSLITGTYFNNMSGGDVSVARDLRATTGSYFYNSGLINIEQGANVIADTVFRNFAGAELNVGTVLNVAAGGAIYDWGQLNTDSVSFNADRVDTRRSGDYIFNGSVVANSYYANVGRWQDADTSSITVFDSANVFDVSIISAGEIILRGDIQAVGAVYLNAAGDIVTQATSNANAGGNLTAYSSAAIENYGAIQSDSDIRLRADSYLSNLNGSVVRSRLGSLVATARGGNIVNDGLLSSQSGLVLTSRTSGIINNSTGEIASLGDIALNAETEFRNNLSALVSSGQAITASAGTHILNNGVLSAINDVDLESYSGYIYNQNNGLIQTRSGNVNIQSEALFQALSGSLISSGGDISIASQTSSLINTGRLSANDNIALISETGYVHNRDLGVVETVAGDITVNAATSYRNYATGWISAGQDLNISSTSVLNNYGTLIASRDLTLTSHDSYIFNRTGASALTIAGDLSLSAGTNFQNFAGGLVSSGHDLTIGTQSYIKNFGMLGAVRDLSLTATDSYINNYNEGVISANQDVTLVAAASIENQVGSSISVGGTASLTAENFIHDFGNFYLGTTGSLEFEANTVHVIRDNNYAWRGDVSAETYLADVGGWTALANSSVTTTKGIEVISGAQILNYGHLDAGTDVSFTAGSFIVNADGARIDASGNLIAIAIGSIENQSMALIDVGQLVQFDAGEAINDFGALSANAIDFDGRLVQTFREGAYVLNGTIDAQNYIAEVGAWTARVNSHVLAEGDLSILSAGKVENYGELNSSASLSIEATGHLTNASQAILHSHEGVFLTSTQGLVRNALHANIIGSGGLFISASTDIHNDGDVDASGDILLAADRNIYQSVTGQSHSLQSISLNAGQNIDNEGVFNAADRVAISADGYFENVTDGFRALNGISVTAAELRGETFAGLRTKGDFSLTLDAGDIYYNQVHQEYTGSLILNAVSGKLDVLTDASSFNGDVALIAGGSVTLLGDVVATDNILIHSGGAFTLSSLLSSGESIQLDVDSFSNTQAGSVRAAETVIIQSNTNVNNANIIDAKGDLIINVIGGHVYNSGSVHADNTLTLQAGTYIHNIADISANLAVEIFAVDEFKNFAHGSLSAFGQLSIASGAEWENVGTLTAGGNLTVEAGDVLLNSGMIDVVSDASFTSATSYVRNTGEIKADKFDLYASSYFQNVTNGVVAQNGISVSASALTGAGFDGLRTTGDFALDLSEGDITYNPADHAYSGDLYLNAIAGNVTYSGGSSFDGNLSLIAGDTVYLTGDLQTTGDLLIDTGSAISLQNTYSAGADLYLFAASLTNGHNGTLQAGDSLIVDVEGHLTNNGNIKGDVVSLAAGADIINSFSAANALPLQSRLSPSYNQFWQTYMDMHNITAYMRNDVGKPHLENSGYIDNIYGAAHHHYVNSGRVAGWKLPLNAFSDIELLAINTNAQGTISGSEVYIDSAEGSVSNIGRIHGSEIVSLSANGLINTGSITSSDFIGVTLDGGNGNFVNDLAVIYAGSDIYLEGSGDFTNSRGSIVSDGSLSAIFDGDINNKNVVFDYHGNEISPEFIMSFRHADIVAGTQLWLEAGGDIINHGGRLAAGDDLVAIAGGNINNIARRNYTIINDDYITDNDPGTTCSGGLACGKRATDYSASEIVSGGLLELRAGKDIENLASHIGGFGDTIISADGNIVVESLASIYTEAHIKKRGLLGISKKEFYSESAILREASLQSGAESLFVDAGHDIGLIGAVLSSAGNTHVTAGNDILMTAVAVEGENYAKKRGFSGLSYTSRRRYWNDFYIIQPEITGYDISLEAGRNVSGFAAYVASFNDLDISAGTYNADGTVDIAGDILLDSIQNIYYENESGFSFGLSFPGSNFLDAIITGQGSEGIARAYLNENPFFSSMYALANSETGAEAAFNLVNTATRGAAFGSRLLATTGPGNSFVDGLKGPLNPFAALHRAYDGELLDGNTSPLDNLASVLTISFSTWSNTREWSESVLSDISAGGDVTLTASQDIQLVGGSQLTAFGDATVRAERDFIMAAAADWEKTNSSSFGVSLGGNSYGGLTVGLNGSSSTSEADYFTVASLNVGGHLDLYAGQDIAIIGGIIAADSAEIYAGHDLRVQSLQNTSHSENSNWGVSVDFCPNGTPCGGSLSGGGGNTNRQWTDDVSGIFAENDLTIEVEGLTQLVGGVLAAGLSDDFDINEPFVPEGWTTTTTNQPSQYFDNEHDFEQALEFARSNGADPAFFIDRELGHQGWTLFEYSYSTYCDENGTQCSGTPPSGLDNRGHLSLITGSLEVFDLEDTDSGKQWSVAVSVGTDGDKLSGGTVGGSFANYTKEGLTRATISPGEIIVTTATDAERDEIVSNLNRDPLTVQVVTRDDDFRTGDLFLDATALIQFDANLKNIKSYISSIRPDSIVQTTDAKILEDTSNIEAETYAAINADVLKNMDLSVEERALLQIPYAELEAHQIASVKVIQSRYAENFPDLLKDRLKIYSEHYDLLYIKILDVRVRLATLTHLDVLNNDQVNEQEYLNWEAGIKAYYSTIDLVEPVSFDRISGSYIVRLIDQGTLYGQKDVFIRYTPANGNQPARRDFVYERPDFNPNGGDGGTRFVVGSVSPQNLEAAILAVQSAEQFISIPGLNVVQRAFRASRLGRFTGDEVISRGSRSRLPSARGSQARTRATQNRRHIDNDDVGVEWGAGNKKQGDPYENYLERVYGSENRLPAGARTFDYFDEASGLAVSVKTLDTLTPSRLTDAKKIYSTLKPYIDKVDQYSDVGGGTGVPFGADDIVKKHIDLGVRKGTSAAQWAQIGKAIRYARERNITIIVRIIG